MFGPDFLNVELKCGASHQADGPPQVEQATRLNFTAVVFDCEGCMLPVLRAAGDRLNRLNTVSIAYVSYMHHAPAAPIQNTVVQ